MRLRSELGICLLTVGLLTTAGSRLLAQSQPAAPASPTPPCSASPQPAPCTTTPAKPSDKDGSTTDKFPFPGEAAPTADAPKVATPATPPDAPAAPSGKNFPFPGEDQPAAAPAPTSGSSSSSSSSDPTAFPSDDTNAADPNAAGANDNSTKDKAAAPDGRRLLKRVNPIGTKLQSPDEREAEDLDVAKFYTQTGDLQGAYLRSKDAVKTKPDDPDAHCALAQTAARLNKRDEAIAEFNACLKLDPEEKEAKNARKELAKLK